MPRLHLFEFEDQSWCPSVLRRGMTDYLAEVTARTNPYAPVIEPLRALLLRYPGSTVVDLCSGGGGPWPQLVPQLQAGGAFTRLVLTDAFPNPDALARFAASAPVTYRQAPLTATAAPAEPFSVRTLFSSFHHFAPADARQILASAVAAKTPIAIFEATERSPKAIAAMAVVPVAVWALTPLIRPLRWWRLLFTYLVPLIPLLAWWDGTVSCLRTYSPDELRTLTADATLAGFEWQAGQLRAPGAPLPVTYLIGGPRGVAPGTD